MNTGQLHVIGIDHEARYSEDFDAQLDEAINNSAAPAQLRAALTTTELLTVLAHFAGAGRHEPDNHPTGDLLSILEHDTADPRLRRYHWAWYHAGNEQGRLIFTGITIAPQQTIIATVSYDPG